MSGVEDQGRELPAGSGGEAGRSVSEFSVTRAVKPSSSSALSLTASDVPNDRHQSLRLVGKKRSRPGMAAEPTHSPHNCMKVELHDIACESSGRAPKKKSKKETKQQKLRDVVTENMHSSSDGLGEGVVPARKSVDDIPLDYLKAHKGWSVMPSPANQFKNLRVAKKKSKNAKIHPDKAPAEKAEQADKDTKLAEGECKRSKLLHITVPIHPQQKWYTKLRPLVKPSRSVIPGNLKICNGFLVLDPVPGFSPVYQKLQKNDVVVSLGGYDFTAMECKAAKRMMKELLAGGSVEGGNDSVAGKSVRGKMTIRRPALVDLQDGTSQSRSLDTPLPVPTQKNDSSNAAIPPTSCPGLDSDEGSGGQSPKPQSQLVSCAEISKGFDKYRITLNDCEAMISGDGNIATKWPKFPLDEQVGATADIGEKQSRVGGKKDLFVQKKVLPRKDNKSQPVPLAGEPAQLETLTNSKGYVATHSTAGEHVDESSLDKTCNDDDHPSGAQRSPLNKTVSQGATGSRVSSQDCRDRLSKPLDIGVEEAGIDGADRTTFVHNVAPSAEAVAIKDIRGRTSARRNVSELGCPNVQRSSPNKRVVEGTPSAEVSLQNQARHSLELSKDNPVDDMRSHPQSSKSRQSQNIPTVQNNTTETECDDVAKVKNSTVPQQPGEANTVMGDISCTMDRHSHGDGRLENPETDGNGTKNMKDNNEELKGKACPSPTPVAHQSELNSSGTGGADSSTAKLISSAAEVGCDEGVKEVEGKAEPGPSPTLHTTKSSSSDKAGADSGATSPKSPATNDGRAEDTQVSAQSKEKDVQSQDKSGVLHIEKEQKRSNITLGDAEETKVSALEEETYVQCRDELSVPRTKIEPKSNPALSNANQDMVGSDDSSSENNSAKLVSCKQNTTLLLPEDSRLVTDYVFAQLSQVQPCFDSEKDQPFGLECIHCSNEVDSFRVFPRSERRLGSLLTPIYQHMKEKCAKIPKALLAEITSAEGLQTRQYATRPQSGQSQLLENVWKRLQASKTSLEQPCVLKGVVGPCKVVHPEDRQLVTDFIFELLEQVQPCWDSAQHQSLGLECIHCQNEANAFRVFPASERRFATHLREIHEHFGSSCSRIPKDLLSKLKSMESLQTRQYATRPQSGQSQLLEKVWKRLQASKSLLLSSDSTSTKSHEVAKTSVAGCTSLSPKRRALGNSEGMGHDLGKTGKHRISAKKGIGRPKKKQARMEIDNSMEFYDSETKKLVERADRKLVSDYIFLLMDQVQSCGPGEGHMLAGFECIHCSQEPNVYRAYPTSVRRLGNYIRPLHDHLKKCRKVPKDVVTELSSLQDLQTSQYTTLKPDDQSKFFDNVWSRLHS